MKITPLAIAITALTGSLNAWAAKPAAEPISPIQPAVITNPKLVEALVTWVDPKWAAQFAVVFTDPQVIAPLATLAIGLEELAFDCAPQAQEIALLQTQVSRCRSARWT